MFDLILTVVVNITILDMVTEYGCMERVLSLVVVLGHKMHRMTSSQ